MRTAAKRLKGQGLVAPALLMALLALACLRAARAQAAAEGVPGAGPLPDEQAALHWPIPLLRIGGVLAYDARRDWTQQQQRDQTGVRATLNLSTNTYIWEPWLAQLDGTLGVTMSRSRGDGNEAGILKQNSSTSAIMTGTARLSVLARSAFPFEAHFDRSNSRVTSDLWLGNAYASERYGFTQHYQRPEGDTMIGWDRAIQLSATGSRDRQDGWQLGGSHLKGNHRMQLAGDGSKNTHEQSGEYALQNNLSLQYGFTPDESLSVENLANFSRSGYHLQQDDNLTKLVQLSSLAMWRPQDQDLTVSGGARLFALDLEHSQLGVDGNAQGSRMHNLNFNAGANYDLSRTTRLNAVANLNQGASGGVKSASANQGVGASYQPAGIALGPARYTWSSSVQASNSSGALGAGRQLALQLGHNLGHSIRLDGGSTLSLDGSQNLAAVMSSSASGPSKQLSNSASLSWNMGQVAGANALLRMSASDTRVMGKKDEFFQLVNLQASGNLATGAYSGWSGNLTIQASRQSANLPGNPGNPADPFYAQPYLVPTSTFMTTSSGSVRYQNQRLFGIASLRAATELRLNSQALLPLLGKAEDQATAAWDNRIDYAIGRTRLSLSAMIARNPAPARGVLPGAAKAAPPSGHKLNRGVAFYLSRSFGNF